MRTTLWMLLFGLCQCGYNWGHETRELPGGHKTVYVELFENKTEEVGLETQFSQAITQQLQRSGFALVTNRDSAELIIEGNVLSFNLVGAGSDPTFVAKDYSAPTPTDRTSTRYSASFFTAYSVRLSVNLKAIRSRDKQNIWQTNLSGSRSFQSARLKKQRLRSSNVLYNEARKKETIELLAKEMMSDAFDRMTENF